jgi:hypothetical protein
MGAARLRPLLVFLTQARFWELGLPLTRMRALPRIGANRAAAIHGVQGRGDGGTGHTSHVP